MPKLRTRLKSFTTGFIPAGFLLGLLLGALYLLSEATGDSDSFGRLYSTLLLITVGGAVVLVGFIAANLYRLVRQLRSKVIGSQLTLRMVTMFVLLAVVPVSVVYYFSLKFLHEGIDSWFDVRIDQALQDALDLSRTALDVRMRVLLRQTEQMAAEFDEVPDVMAALALLDLRVQSNANELTLLGANGRIIASSSTDPTDLLPDRPGEGILLQVRQSGSYVGLDPIRDTGLHVRVVVPAPPVRPSGEGRLLQALFPVAERMSILASSVQDAYGQYRELAYLRKPLKYSFTITLSLVLLLSLLFAVWAAFFTSRRLVAPIRALASGTRAVAQGDYDKRLSQTGHGELSGLVKSFNDMTRRLAAARDQARRSQNQVEGQRAYLETLLVHLSSGVLSFDADHSLRTANTAAAQILGIDLLAYQGLPLEKLVVEQPALRQLAEVLAPHLEQGDREWREEVTLFRVSGRQVLMCRGAALPAREGRPAGHVVVFDDITALIKAQRDAAWGEVARRLAHEIKNPLTPIQLSAERLRRKYLNKMDPEDAEVLDRSTHTIVQQVDAMKEMVNAFSEYARAPSIELVPLDLNGLISEVLDLYRGDKRAVTIQADLDPRMPLIEADSGRLRQVLHNLIKNALESLAGRPDSRLDIITRCMQEEGCRFVEMRVKDNGPGFAESLLDHLFEPYVTTKPKGTGLGLAIVKKIIEEHGGVIWGENPPEGGACITIRLPARGAGSQTQDAEMAETA